MGVQGHLIQIFKPANFLSQHYQTASIILADFVKQETKQMKFEKLPYIAVLDVSYRLLEHKVQCVAVIQQMGIFLVLLQADLPYFPQTTSALLKV
jgi:hypothetical protein